jgi:diketogulonate reductase-like aldo/keto reductase
MQTTTVRGRAVPRIGLGTWRLRGRACRDAVADALALGYRHVDTAAMYDNEEAVGAALRDSGVDREAVWLTTKVWHTDLEPRRLRASAEESLRRLGVDRLDLLLVHWPGSPDTNDRALDELVRLRDEGRIAELGVSNFPAGMLERAIARAPVFCDQVEYHVHLGQERVRAVAGEHDVLVAAYRPLGGGRGVLDDPLVEEIARAHDRTPAQVALRWLVEQEGVCVLPRSADPGRRRENLDVFSFTLTDADRAALDRLAAGQKRYVDVPWAPDWDG